MFIICRGVEDNFEEGLQEPLNKTHHAIDIDVFWIQTEHEIPKSQLYHEAYNVAWSKSPSSNVIYKVAVQ